MATTTPGYVFTPDAIAREAGFHLPIALTRAAHEGCVAWTDADLHRTGVPQDEEGRLWDVLSMARRAVADWRSWVMDADPGDTVAFTVYRVPRDLDRSRLAELEDDPDGMIAQPVRLVVRRGAAYMLVIDFAKAVRS
jgi:hypothetical protein